MNSLSHALDVALAQTPLETNVLTVAAGTVRTHLHNLLLGQATTTQRDERNIRRLRDKLRNVAVVKAAVLASRSLPAEPAAWVRARAGQEWRLDLALASGEVVASINALEWQHGLLRAKREERSPRAMRAALVHGDWQRKRQS